MRGQVSIEFIVYFSIVILIGAYFLTSYLITDQRLYYINMENEVDTVLKDIVYEINSAVTSGPGYERKFFIPENIGGYSNYKITVGNNLVFIDWDNRSKSKTIITESINGKLSKGWNWIRNVNGVIYVN